MFATLSNSRRFHVVSFVLVAVCFAAMSLFCQNAVMGQEASGEETAVAAAADVGENNSSGQEEGTALFSLCCYAIISIPIIYLCYTLFFRPFCCDFKTLIDLCKKWGDKYYPDIKSDYFNDSFQLKEIQNTLSSLDPKSPEYKDFKKKNIKTVRRIYYTRFFECWGIFCSKHYRLATTLGIVTLISTISFLVTIIRFIVDYIIPLLR